MDIDTPETIQSEIVDIAPRFTGEPEVTSWHAPHDTLNDVEMDHIVVQVVVACKSGGHKVHEITYQPVKLFHPFSVQELIRRAERMAGDQWRESGGVP